MTILGLGLVALVGIIIFDEIRVRRGGKQLFGPEQAREHNRNPVNNPRRYEDREAWNEPAPSWAHIGLFMAGFGGAGWLLYRAWAWIAAHGVGEGNLMTPALYLGGFVLLVWGVLGPWWLKIRERYPGYRREGDPYTRQGMEQEHFDNDDRADRKGRQTTEPSCRQPVRSRAGGL